MAIQRATSGIYAHSGILPNYFVGHVSVCGQWATVGDFTTL
jgi:hypothetical protein